MNQPEIPAISVLLIEDEPFIRNTLKRILQSLGVSEVQEAVDGASALRMLQVTFRPQLIICDVQMKPMDGLTFLRNLRAMPDPVRATLPIIMLTAVADETTIHAFVNLTVSGYLLKPVSRKQLAERINSVFRRIEAADQAAVAPAV